MLAQVHGVAVFHSCFCCGKLWSALSPYMAWSMHAEALLEGLGEWRKEGPMNTPETIMARIKFLAATQDEQGQITHQRGEIMQGAVIKQAGDFLLVRTATGACICVDASRRDLYCVDLQ